MLDSLDQSIITLPPPMLMERLQSSPHSITNGDRIFIKGSNGSGAWRIRDALFSAMTTDAPKRKLKEASHAICFIAIG